MGESAWSDWKGNPKRRKQAILTSLFHGPRYPIELGHNFVLAHAGCNSAKAYHLAASVHLGRRVERNQTAAAFLQEPFDQGLIVHRARKSEGIASWLTRRPLPDVRWHE
jgi:hypothetical protein